MSLFGGEGPPNHSTESGHSPSVSPYVSRASSPEDHEREQDAQIVPDDPSDPELSDPDEDTIRDITSNGISLLSRYRFQGTDAQWRNYTRDERTLAKCLDELRSEDLAAHLYNVHAWKRERKALPDRTTSATQASNPATENKSTKPWRPPGLWTRWPLLPALVPHPDQRFSSPALAAASAVEAYTILRDILEAHALRRATRTWQARPARSSPPPNSRGPPQPEREIHISLDPAHAPPLLRPALNSLLSRLDSLLTALHHNRVGQDAYGLSATMGALRASERRRSSTARARANSSAREKARRRRVSSSGSERGRRASGRTARSGSSRRDDGDDEYVDDDEGVESEDDDEGADRRPRKRQRTASARRSRSSSAAGEEQAASGHRARHPRRWGEVLACAALSGWDAAAVERARKRCEALFREEVKFPNVLKQVGEADQWPAWNSA